MSAGSGLSSWCLCKLRGQSWIAVFVVSALVAFGGQWLSGAYDRDFSFSGDEPSHFVTSLMVRDYLRGGLGENPMRFAENYYLHYPKVGMGHWPPGFYAALGAWMLVWGGTQSAAACFLALTSAAVSVLLWLSLKERAGMGPAWFAALAFPLLPLVQVQSSVVMTEVPGALALFAVSLAVTGCLGGAPDAWRIAGLVASAVAAIYVRPSGWQLALGVPLGLALAGRLRQVFSRGLLVAGAVTGLICLPFYLRFLPAIQEGTKLHMGLAAYAKIALPRFTGLAGMLLTPLPTLALVAGLARIGRPWRAGADPFWGVMLGAWLAALAFPVVTPASFEARHLVPMAAPGLALAAYGLARLTAGRSRPWTAAVVAAALAAVAVASVTYGSRPPRYRSFGEAVDILKSDRQLDRSRVLLISSSYDGEGRLIAELASREGCCRRVVLRASQQLAEASWDARSYRLRYADAGAVRRGLEQKGIGLVLVHEFGPQEGPLRHHELLREALEGAPGGEWQLTNLVRRSPGPGVHPETISFYRHKRLFGSTPRTIEIDTTRRLGRQLRLNLE